MILILLNSKKKINETSKFVEIYESNCELKIADLNEISNKRSLK